MSSSILVTVTGAGEQEIMEFPKLSILLFSGTVILRGAYSIGYAGSSTYGAASSGVMRSGFFVFMSARNQQGLLKPKHCSKIFFS